MLHEQGTVGFQDVHQALLWHKKAAEQGHTAAEASLGRILYQGVDSGDTSVTPQQTKRDITQAIHFLQRAAAKVPIQFHKALQLYLFFICLVCDSQPISKLSNQFPSL